METWIRPRPGRVGYRRDALLALAIAIGGGLSAALYSRLGLYDHPAPMWLTIVAIIGFSLPLALRRRYPAIIAVVVSLDFFVVGQFLVPEALVSQIAMFMAIYSLGAWGRDRRRANIVRAVIVVGMLIWVFGNLIVTVSDPELLPNFSRSGVFSQFAAWSVIQIATNLLYFLGAWAFGNAMWASARQRALLEEQASELRAEREFSAAQAVALDRVRIARELHDVVAHHVSVMGVQAGAARRVLASDSAQAFASLETVEQSARAAVDELHKLLGTLRDSGSTDGADAGGSDAARTSSSTRGIEQLDELVNESIDAGLPVTLSVVGQTRRVTGLVGFTIYRLAQEALTNTRKHGGERASADVRLRYLTDEIELEVTDTGLGGGRSTASAPSGLGQQGLGQQGLGQQGMRERVAAVGGEIEFGSRAGGGYLVRARVPIAPEVRS